MDISLDDYITKSNRPMRIQIGNKNAPPQGKKLTKLPAGQKTLTVTAGVPKVPGVQSNSTNQVRDARDKLNQTRPQDARYKLNQKAQSTDARQKLINIRARKTGPPGAAATGPVDARAKIQAKQQQKTGSLTLTRTVNNSQVQINSGPGGNIQVTKTLSTVMPPGYEDLQRPPGPKVHITQRIGGPPSTGPFSAPPRHQGSQQTIITRTIPGPASAQGPRGPRPVAPNVQYNQYPGPGGGPQGPPAPQHVQPYMGPPPSQIQYQGPPPYPPQQYHAQQAPYMGGPPPPGTQPAMQQPPPPQHYPMAGPPQGQYVNPPYPVPQSQPGPPPGQLTRTINNPPYPTEDRDGLQITRTIGQAQIIQDAPESKPYVPVIQVHNDMYQQPAPPPQGPPYPPRQEEQYSRQIPNTYPDTPEPQYSYTSPQQPYPQSQSASIQRTVPNDRPLKKTIVNTGSEPPRESLKRKPSGGPLRMSHTSTPPVIQDPYLDRPKKSSKPSVAAHAVEPPVKRVKEESAEDVPVISPLQGIKVAVSNLHTNVTHDDIIELFGAVGIVKQVKMLRPGSADVYYVKREDAAKATQTYHNRELDGLPMQVKLMTPPTAKVKYAPDDVPPSVKPMAAEPLKLYKRPPGMSKLSSKGNVDVGTVHKALFKTGTQTHTKPVTFTVNI